MEISRVQDEAGARSYQEVAAAACEHDFLALPADPPREFAGLLSTDPAVGKASELYLGRHHGQPAAVALLSLPTRDNPDAATLELQVTPALRRRGLGTALWAHVADLCRALGRPVVTVDVPGRLDGPPTPGEAFAARHGFTPRLADVRRLLDLATVDEAHLAALAAGAEPHAQGYVLQRWVDRAPAADVDGLAALAARMSTDPPQGGLEHDPEVWDAARWRAGEQHTQDRGRLRLGVLARRGREVVGYTEIGVSREAPAVGYQWDTIVRTDHRGHRLGLLLKLANVRQLRERSAGTRWVNTWNAAENTPMIAINEAIGWRAVDSFTEQQRRL